MAIERFGDGEDFYKFYAIDDTAPSDQEDPKLIAFRAAYLECANKKPSPDPKERTLQKSWAQVGPNGVNGFAGSREDLELTAALLRGYSENTRGDFRMESAFRVSDEIDPVTVELMRAIDDPAILAFDKRLALGTTALGLAEEIETFLEKTPGADGDALEAEFQKLFDKPQAA